MPRREKVGVPPRRSPRLLESERQHSKDDEQSSSNIQVRSHSSRGKRPPSTPNVPASLVLRRSSRLSIPKEPILNPSRKEKIEDKPFSDSHGVREPISEHNAEGKPTKCREMTNAKPPREESRVLDTKKRKKEPNVDEERSIDWTSSQETALHRAYLSAKPNPNFWKEVSKMVPGKSAQECYDKIHSDYKSPLPRSRLKKMNPAEQPQELSASKVLRIGQSNPKSKPKFRRRGANSLAKHHSTDARPVLNDLNGGDFSSPAVLKPVKNIGLHEKFLGQLHNREMKRKAASTRSKETFIGKENTSLVEHVRVKAAKSALLSHARFAVSQLLHPQFDSHSSLID